MSELDSILDICVDEQKRMLEDDKIFVLVSCSMYFLQKSNIYTCRYNLFFFLSSINCKEKVNSFCDYRLRRRVNFFKYFSTIN